MGFKGFKCIRCGHCCFLPDALSSSVPDADVKMWKDAGREDILEWVDIFVENGRKYNEIWINPDTGGNVDRCPWLSEDNECKIHDVKPTVCRRYPKNRRHARDSGCKGEY